MPPPGPPSPPLQCLRLTAKSLLRRLRCQEDLSLKKKVWPAFGRDHKGTQGGRGSQPPPPPPQPPSDPPAPLRLHPLVSQTSPSPLFLDLLPNEKLSAQAHLGQDFSSAPAKT